MRQRQRQKFREEKYVQNLWQSCLVLMMWSSRKGQLGKLAKLQLKMECARGDTPSSARLFDAIVSGCIPVIVSDELELPFEGIIDYRKAIGLRVELHEKLRLAVLVSKAAFQFIQGIMPSEYKVPQDVKAEGYDICPNELSSIVEGHDLKKLTAHGGATGIANKLCTSAENCWHSYGIIFLF